MERWPVVDGIPYLRAGSEGLQRLALDCLDAGDEEGALVALLTDQDDWWTGPATDLAELKQLVRGRDTLTLREAMALLRLGPVADYFAYRWSDPTYLAALALLEAHWNAPKTSFELACGIGHFARELARFHVACVCADVVFAKCWLAKHWVAPAADYLVFDAAHPWPICNAKYDLVQCHDAFYFLPDQPTQAERLRAAVADGGVLAVSHVHNAEWHRTPFGPAKTADEWAALFPRATAYDEADLFWALLQASTPTPHGWAQDWEVEAFSAVEGWPGPPRPVKAGLTVPAPDARLRPNPLLTGRPEPDSAAWPSERYRDEYIALSFWQNDEASLPEDTRDPVRLRRLVDLPGRW